MNWVRFFKFCAVLGFTVLAFQNCGKVSMLINSTKAAQVLSVSNLLVKTTLNHPVTVKLQNSIQATISSLAADKVLTEQTLTNGRVTLDPNAKTITFTPNAGFRGTVTTNVYTTFENVTNVQTITFEVDNPTLDFKPAMAVRAPLCILCHANVQGDFITDFGYKSSVDSGPDLFMSTVTPQNWIGAYGFHYRDGNTFPDASIGGKLIIPQIDLTSINDAVPRSWFPNDPRAQTPPVQSLSDFITADGLPHNSQFGGISEKKLLYIGAPTAADIQSAGQLTTNTRQTFFVNTPSDPPLSGLQHVQTDAFDYFTNDSLVPFICEGDLFVDGVVWLNHLNLQTTYGCRIYATRSVFINGPIVYTNVSALSNLEISSAVGVYMGFGYCINCADADPTAFNYQYTNTVESRWRLIADDNSMLSLRTKSVEATMNDAIADAKLVMAMPSPQPPAPPSSSDVAAFTAYNLQMQQLMATQNVRLLDASNSFVNEGSTTYSRLFLNAPVVMSRYSGNYQGIIIAEFAMWRLGQFSFNFDPVFTGVSLLPFLDFTKILQIEN